MLRKENTHSLSGWLGGQELLLGATPTVEEVVSIVDSIQLDDPVRVAHQLLTPEKLNLAVVGPCSGQPPGRATITLV